MKTTLALFLFAAAVPAFAQNYPPPSAANENSNIPGDAGSTTAPAAAADASMHAAAGSSGQAAAANLNLAGKPSAATAATTYPSCSRTVTDNCVDRGRRR